MKGNFETIASPEQPSGAISPVREKYVINNVYSNTTTIAREKYRKDLASLCPPPSPILL